MNKALSTIVVDNIGTAIKAGADTVLHNVRDEVVVKTSSFCSNTVLLIMTCIGVILVFYLYHRFLVESRTENNDYTNEDLRIKKIIDNC